MAREQRRLAAILAADAVGYSRLMGRDESGTLAVLKAHRTDRLEPALARNGGRLIKLTGDGALAEFGSAVDALRSAIEFQQSVADANRDQPEDTRIVFRIGLHLGDLIVDGDDLYGDGVNVAARLETEAPPSGIVISGNVHDAVAGRLKASFDDLGRKSLKNIERPIHVFAITWEPADWKVAAMPSPVLAHSGVDDPSKQRLEHRLAAIVFADVAGYSRLMGRDEIGTLAALKMLRREVVAPRIVAHSGRILKTTGDGLLLEFPSVIDAVRCVIEVQTEMVAKVADVPEDRQVAFRIGVNLGDIIIDGDNIFGDGVNIAARLQEIATPGGVCVSGRVHDDVRDRLDTVFADGGTQVLKHITRPVQVWRWSPRASTTTQPVIAQATDVPLTLPDKPSIAVLPFQNMSGDPEQEYFADGMVEDIITALSRFKSLFVIARNSTFTYKGRAVDIKQVGRELGVRYVLEGSIRKAGGRVRITGQLIDSATGAHLWADRFESSLEDIFELQDQMTTSVVGAVVPKLDQAEIERSKRKPVENLDAYDCYLRGMAQTHLLTRGAVEEGLRLFYQAIELDPGFSTPYGLAARFYAIRKVQGWVVDKDFEEAETRRLGLRVSAIGRDDALALCWSGFALAFVCREYETGAALLDEALAINQNLAVCWINRGIISVYLGQHETAIEQFTRAMRLSPLDQELYRSETNMAVAHLFQGRYDEALNWAARALVHQPNWMVALRASAVASAHAGNIPEAQKIMARMRQINPALRLSQQRDFIPFRRPQDIERMIDGLRLAGLPE